MTPELKAKELVDKYNGIVYPYTSSSMLTNEPDENVILSNSKICAIILVDEILKGEHLVRTPLSFWQKVKIEIELL